MSEWLLVSIFAGLCSSGFNYLNRYILRVNRDSTAYAWWFEALRTLFFIILMFFDSFINITLTNILILLLLGTVEFFSVYIFMKMHKFTHLSLSTIIARLRVIWVPILALVFLNEKLTVSEYLGMLVIFIGLTIVLSPKRIKIDKGVKITFISSLVVAVLSLVTKRASEIASTPFVLIFMGAPTVLMFPFVMKDWKRRVSGFWKIDKLKIIMAVAFNIAAMYFLVWAYRIGSVSKVTGIYNSMMVVLVLAGIFMLNEKKNALTKIIGSFVVLIGVFLIN